MTIQFIFISTIFILTLVENFVKSSLVSDLLENYDSRVKPGGTATVEVRINVTLHQILKMVKKIYFLRSIVFLHFERKKRNKR